MARLIEAHNGDAEEEALRAMFAARKQVFVDLLKWNLPTLDGRFEVDQFDNRHARYLILVDELGRHLGSTRLLPTTRPHILDTLFPDLCDDTPPRGRQIFEITRFCLDRSLRAEARRLVRNQLVTAIAEHALASGIREYTGVAEMAWLQQILSFGWDCAPLGLPVRHGGRLLGALTIKIAADTPARLQNAGTWLPVTEPALPERRVRRARG